MIPWFEPPPSPLPLDAPSLLALAGVALGGWLARRQAQRGGLDARRAVDGYFLAVVAALVGAHLADVLLYRRAELARAPGLLWPWAEGYASVGAFAGAGIALWRYHRPSPRGPASDEAAGWQGWQHIDNLASPMAAALLLARVGCFLGHHHAGRLAEGPLAVAYPGGARHDLGLDEALGLAALLAALLWLGRRGHPTGTLAAVAALGYGVARFLVEQVRGDDLERIGRRSDPRYLGWTLAQHAAVALVGLGLALLAARAPVRSAARPRPRGRRPGPRGTA